MQNKSTNIVVVGGGSAGWLTAGLVAAKHKCKDFNAVTVTLIEAPDIATIGVGEGTWPSMRSTLKEIGVSETDFILNCDVSFKQGSKFVSWQNSTKQYYYHPFSLPQGYQELNLAPFWQGYRDRVSFSDAVCPQSFLCDLDLAPKQISTPEFAFNLNYGYHLNAGKFSEFLSRHCIENLGVKHIKAKVINIDNDKSGYVSSLHLDNGQMLEGDIFVDCTGFACLLLGKHYNIPFESKKDILMNDRAIALQASYADENAPIASCTIATGQNSGWTWDIGLPTRRGIGYVFSSAHTDNETAERCLRDYAQKTGARNSENLSSRTININPGYRQKFWHKNVVAIGISAGFIEPLEASALVLVETSARMLSEQLPTNRDVMEVVSKRFNQTFLYRWERIIDFLKLHYVLSERDDSDYWQDMRAATSIPDSLNELMMLWRFQPPYTYDHNRADELFPSASFQFILYGMGFVTQADQSAAWVSKRDVAEKMFQDNLNRTNQLRQALPTNRELLNKINEYGLSRI